MIRNVETGVTGGIGGIRYAENGVTKNIPVAYVVENGITRLVFEEDNSTVAYHGSSLTLNTARRFPVSESVGNYLLIGGGCGPGGSGSNLNLSSVETINGSLTKGTTTSFGTVRDYLNYEVAHARTKNHAVFIGGISADDTADAYDASLTKTSPFTQRSAYECWCGYINNLLVVLNRGYGLYSIYDDSFTRLAADNWSGGNMDAVGAATHNHIILAGGYANGGDTNAVDAFDSSATKTALTGLVNARRFMTGLGKGNHAMFTSGFVSSGGTYTYYSDMDVYDDALTKSIAPPLTSGKGYVAALKLGNYGLFAGGITRSNGYTFHTSVDIYDKRLTKTAGRALNIGKANLTGGSVGDYGIFACGETLDSMYVNTTDIYKLQ